MRTDRGVSTHLPHVPSPEYGAMELELSTGHIGSYVFNDVGAVIRATATRHGLTTFSPDRSTYLP